ncbi:WD40-repeat-containing domain protein [Catenaria anguillulae PL171]|uniref:WD40-repeat-containing domain protein n=1 Tax=Catenaria anguillulae PL171 TaxID=765915 RepID=A0A1Y2HSN6_9FUNG|nr:WD40-repeat-containing domain protein [Catenaria anguillulae PL171]
MPPPPTVNNSPYTRESIWACLPATTRGQPTPLDAHPKGTLLAYTNGRTVVLRDLAHPHIASEYTGHSFPVTVARFSPSGFYVASADVRGNVRIWDCTQPDQVLKSEFQVLSGAIHDLCWDAESKRIIVVGEGKEKFAHAFFFDSGSSCGEIMGHSKVANGVAIKPTRPFRAATCADDLTVNFYTGVPYKFATSIADHSRFVTAVKYAPDGSKFVSVALDGKIFLYDGTSGDKIKEVVDAAGNGHKGGIFAVAWGPDSKQFITSSADCTCKLWDVEASKVITTWTFDSSPTPNPANQQVGNLWHSTHLLTLSLSGDLHYLDPKTGAVARTITGHQKNITALTYAPATHTLVTGSYDGHVRAWDDTKPEAGARKVATGESDAQVQDLTVASADDAIHEPVAQAPKDASAIAISADKAKLAIGTTNRATSVFALDPATGKLSALIATVDNSKGAVTALGFSPDAGLLAAGDGSGKLVVYAVTAKSVEVKLTQWAFHTARITSVAWHDSGKYAVSSSLDTGVGVWSVDKPMAHVMIRNAHVDAAVGAVWVGEKRVASVGADGCVKRWKIEKMPGE